jgi:5-methyltetrahydropteroyltriglutamate--homocysteine methyltransferase
LRRSTDRILTTHAGGLERPPELSALLRAKERGEPYDQREFNRRVADAVAEIVEKQEGAGIDIVNDGEESKSWLNYARDRLGGLVRRPLSAGEEATDSITAREETEFGEYFRTVGFGFSRGFAGGGALREVRDAAAIAGVVAPMAVFCTGPLEYIGMEAAQTDIENIEKAVAGKELADAVLTAIAPGTIEHWLRNQYYPDTESFLFAIADAMNAEYRAITDAGIILQIDDPDLPDAWAIHPEMTLSQYRDYAELRVEAINRALKGVPEDMVRLHICWGSVHGPHVHDLPLRDFVDIVLKVKAQAYSIEAANPRHDHEWTVWQDVKLPDGKILIPGVVGHYTDIIEHPELIAERLESYASVVGRENVIAGTDCGLGPRVGHPKIAWAKFEAMAEGARIASQRLWR